MKILSITVVLVLLVINSGCYPVEGARHTPEIRYFSVLAAPGATAYNYGAAPITPYFDSGNFLIRWELATEGDYQVDLYVSNNSLLDPQDPWGRDDLHFFKQSYRSIGASVDHELHLDSVMMNCQFTVDNVISCGRINYENPGRDITPFLNYLPKPGHLILRACDATLQDCVTAALNVEFH